MLKLYGFSKVNAGACGHPRRGVPGPVPVPARMEEVHRGVLRGRVEAGWRVIVGQAQRLSTG